MGIVVTFEPSRYKGQRLSLKSLKQRLMTTQQPYSNNTNQYKSSTQTMKANFKVISFGGLVALSLCAAPFNLVKPAQAEGGQPGHRLEQLNLSAAQSTQIEAIHTNSHSQIEAVLTPEQRAVVESSGSKREAMRSLDLSDEQRSQIKTIRDNTRTEINAVLTAEQQQQLAAMPEGGPRGGRGGNHGGQRGSRLEDLNLTDAQTAEIEAIRTATRSQSEAVLTPEQRAIVANSDSPRELTREAMRSLDLTDAQREQLRTIHEDSRQKIEAVLTDEQRQQLPQRPERPESRSGQPTN